MIHIPFEQQVKNALTELQKEYPFIYPDYEDVEHYLRQLKNPENLSINGLVEFLLNSPNTEVDDMNVYHSLDLDTERDLFNQVMSTFEGEFTIQNIHQLKDIFPIFHLETQELSISLHINHVAIHAQNTH